MSKSAKVVLVRVNGYDIETMPPFRIASLGVGRKFQTAGIFESLTVAECLRIAVRLGMISHHSCVRSSDWRCPRRRGLLSMPPGWRSRHGKVRQL